MTRLLSFLAIGAALQLAVHSAPVASRGTCDSQQCRKVATEILRDMHPTADPCVDFSQFTCGAFYEREIIPNDAAIFGYANVVNDKNNDIIRAIATPGDPNAPKVAAGDIVNRRNIEKIQNYYASCMDETQIAKVGRQPLVDEIRQLTQLYHVADSDLTNYKSAKRAIPEAGRLALSTIIGQSLGKGSASFIGFNVKPYELDTNRYVVMMSSAGPGQDISAYGNPEITAVYQTVIGEMFTLILGNGQTHGSSIQVPDIWKNVAKDVVEFEAALVQIAFESQLDADPLKTNVPHTIVDLARRVPSLDWNVIFANAFPKDVRVPQSFIVGAPEYLNKLNALLGTTSPKTLQNFLAWILIRENAAQLSEAYSKPYVDYKVALSQAPSRLTRSKTCVSRVSSNLPDLVGHYFIQKVFDEAIGAKIREIVDNIRTTYIHSFETYKWLDSYTREGALKKIKAIADKIGYSLSGPDDGSLPSIDEFYSSLTIETDDYYGNAAKSTAFLAQAAFRQLNGPLDRKHMLMSPQTVNAYYFPLSNDINILAAIMEAPYFDIESPDYLNYGAIGSVVGHEITHGFDNDGRKYDATGDLRNWWSNSSVEAFQAKSQCFIEEYGNFTVKGPNGKDLAVDGENTLPENIADNGGIRKSFETWSALYKSDPSSAKYNNKILPGFEKYTPEQLFFIQWGHLWCSKARPGYAKALLAEDIHSPAKWRINGVVRNLDYFAETFKCKPGTPMNPTNKCVLW
ncbi:hypothetical protein BGX26_011973 [Mortierella sp. AD094]|nr:hypothetical protein BGX26_011973 [Mortierella sp. AD094]